MRTVVLIRKSQSDDGTFGVLITDSGKRWYTGELPWRDNCPSLSCIPSGEYDVQWLPSPKLGRSCYHVTNVPKRSGVLIHAGNWCGDVLQHKKSDVEGCIILGKGKQLADGQYEIVESRVALKEFEDEMKTVSFKLYVHDPGDQNEMQVDAGVA